MTLLLGAVADDFTGATDLANTLVQQGMRVTQLIGVPDKDIDIGDAQAVVVALKSRMVAPEYAVEWSLQALRWLQGKSAHQFFFKYCSTFDSTRRGNIGPVSDAMHEYLASN
ncbi:MAG: four-carbon acid sugar kinase family protein, partial [Sneathiella sp.]